MEFIRGVTGNYFLVSVTLVFVAVMLLLEGLYLLWKANVSREAKQVEKRLHQVSFQAAMGRNQILKAQTLGDASKWERLLMSMPQGQFLQKMIHQAGMGWSASRLLLVMLSTGLLGWLVADLLLHQPLLLSLGIAVCMLPVPLLLVLRKRRKRLARIEQQLPDSLDVLVRALRAGHAFSSGLQMIGEEVAEPLAGEFRLAADEVSFGVALQQALINMSARVPSTYLRYFVVAVLIQRESGGNLTEVLSNLSKLIRERLKLRAKVRVLSSDGRLSAWILSCMPFALAGIMYWGNPEFMSPLWTDPMGHTILKYTLGMMAIGILVLRKMIQIRV